MSIAAPSNVQSTEPNKHGYRGFSLGEFTFSRDEYFAYVEWPTGKHVMSADAFLKALQRDVAWQFFYGIVNFDGVIGTVNHYGTVDLFAGRYNDVYRKAELDHHENFETSAHQGDLRGDARRLDQRRVRSVRRADRDRLRLRHQERREPRGHHAPSRHRRPDGQRPGRRAAAQRRQRPPGQPPVPRRPPGRAGEAPGAGLRGRDQLVQPVRLPVALAGDVEPVGRLGLWRQPLLPDDRGVHPADHPRQRPRRVVHPAVGRADLAGRGPRCRHGSGQGDDAGRRRGGHAGRHPPPGLRAEAGDAAGLGERRSRSCRRSSRAASCRPCRSSSRPIDRSSPSIRR